MIKVKPSLEKIVPYAPGKPIEELRRQLNIEEIYKLASNEIPFAPTYLKKAVQEELLNINRYPEDGCFYLRKVLSGKLKVKDEQIVFGNGSDEIISCALRALIVNGERVIIGYPSFLVYEIQANVEGAEVKRIPFKNYRYDLEAAVKAVNKKTKMIFIANPDNPHGTCINRIEMSEFLKKIPKEVIVFFDEAYYEFVEDRKFPDSLDFLKKRGNIIISRTFSKAYGLAGLRIGYGVTTTEIASILNKVREPFNINRFAQVCAYNALMNKRFLNKVINHIRKEKVFLYRELEKLNLEFVRSGTNFILVKFDGDVSVLYDYLLKRGIIVRNLTGWNLKNFFRVTVGLRRENRKLIRELRNFLKS